MHSAGVRAHGVPTFQGTGSIGRLPAKGVQMITEQQPLPPIGGLSQRQQRGMDCVFCGIVLTPATAVDLGPRRLRIADYTTRWFPRACRRHASEDSS